MMKFNETVNHRQTAQTQAIPGREAEMQRNPSGGMNFTLSDNQFLLRFLLTGAGAGTCNVGSRTDVTTSISRLTAMVRNNGGMVLGTTVEFSKAGRGPSNDPALYVLALCLAHGDDTTKRLAMSQNNLCGVVRTGTHLFTLMEYIKSMRGFGSGLCRAISRWYTSKTDQDVAYQLLKYRNRNGWTHRDVMRKVHPTTNRSTLKDLFAYACDTTSDATKTRLASAASDHVATFEHLQSNPSKAEVLKVLRDNPRTPWEFLPTEYHNDMDVWDTLLPNMNAMALLRNLNRMTYLGLIHPGSEASKVAVEKLTNQEFITRSRLHPFSILNAYTVYSSGSALKGNTVWSPVNNIVDALDDAFYKAFGNVQPTGKRIMLSMDVSGSMDMYQLSSNPKMTARVGAMAMAMVTAAAEGGTIINGFSHELVPVDVSPFLTLNENIQRVHGIPFGRTDCSLPMTLAMADNLEIDAFVIYTDNETWSGRVQPSQALQQYRNQSGINSKLITVAMTGKTYGGTIADPRDPGMLDVVGFDTSTPNLISEFINI